MKTVRASMPGHKKGGVLLKERLLVRAGNTAWVVRAI